MIDTINCTNCGSEIENNISTCYCGYTMSVAEINEITEHIRKANSTPFINEDIGANAKYLYRKLEAYELDKRYLRSKSAKRDFSKKTNFIQSELIPGINFWRESIIESEQQIAKEKLELYTRIFNITEFIINDFFGRFNVNSDDLEFFEEIRDYSKYEIAETIAISNLDFTDIETTNLGEIGSNILSSGFRALENGSLKEISKKSEWTKADRNLVLAEVGLAVGKEVIDGIANLISQNSDAIKHVREVNLQLNRKMRTVGDVINDLSIEQKQLEKLKRVYDRCNLVLDITYKYKLLPIVTSLNNNPLYIEYKSKRTPYDLEQEKIHIDKVVLDVNINLSFWGSLLKGKQSSFKNSWSKRIKSVNKTSKYRIRPTNYI